MRSARALENMRGVFGDYGQSARFLLRMGVCEEPAAHLIPFSTGGLALATEMAHRTGVPLSFAAVSELPSAWPGGPIFGAAAFDGTVVLDDELKELCSVSRDRFHTLVQIAYEEVAELAERWLPANEEFPQLRGRSAVLIDDGHSGLMLTRAAIAAARNAGARRLVLAMPSGDRRRVQQLAAHVDLVYCASLSQYASGREKPLCSPPYLSRNSGLEIAERTFSR